MAEDQRFFVFVRPYSVTPEVVMIELEGSTGGGILVKFFFLYKLFPRAYDPEARSMEFNSDLYVSCDDGLNLFFDGVTGIFTWQQQTVRAKEYRCF